MQTCMQDRQAGEIVVVTARRLTSRLADTHLDDQDAIGGEQAVAVMEEVWQILVPHCLQHLTAVHPSMKAYAHTHARTHTQERADRRGADIRAASLREQRSSMAHDIRGHLAPRQVTHARQKPGSSSHGCMSSCHFSQPSLPLPSTPDPASP